MAQLKDLLVSGAARFLNGIFVLGTSSMNDTNPAETETYSLGTNNLKWKNIYGKDGYIANVHATNLYDAGGATTVADKYISTLAVKTTNGTTFTFKGVDGAGGENSSITVPNHANNVAGLVTSGAQTIYGAKTFNSTITASSSTPIQFTATGTGTYNKAIFYSDANGVTLEVQRASDSSSATALPFLIKSRGGQWNTLKSGPVYINGTATFGNAGQPIYWNSGVPTAIDWHVGNSSLGEHNANNITYNMIGYYNSNGPSGLGEQSTDGAIYAQAYNSNWVGQIAQDYRTGNLFVRGKNNGSWTAWKSVGGGGAIFTYSSSILYDNAKNRFYTNKTDSSWNAQVYSNYGIKDGCSMSFTIDQTTAYIMVGLNTDPKTDASYSSIDYCWYPQSGGALCIYESGSSITCPSGHTTYAAGDEFSIEYVAGFIRYYHNGVLCRQVARTIGSPLYFDSSFYNAGSISAVEFKKITDGENYLQDFHNNYDISTTETVDTKSYLFTAGDTGGWCTTSTKPSGVDNAFGILHAHLHNGNYAMQLGFGGTTDRLYYRNAYATTTWTAWQTLHDSHHDIIPNADLTRNIGSADYKFNNAYLYTLHLRGSSSATMTNGTAPANPKIIFSENGGQQVGIVYTDHDAYRASKGLKVMGTDGSDEGNVWLEVQGNIYAGGTTYLNGQTANRLVWTDTNKALIASYHYAASDRIAINSASAPGYNFYVNGISYFSDLVTIYSGASHKGIKIGNTYINAIDNDLILQNNSAIRFGADNWDYDKWAGLKYTASSKTISLGIADKTVFVANSAQTQGTLEIVQSHVRSNVDNIYDLGTSTLRWRNINLGTAIRQSNRSYLWVGSAAGSKYYKVTLPYNGLSSSSGTRWFMISMEITVGGPYSSGESGKIELAYYFIWDGNSKTWSANNVRGIAIGINMSTVKIYYDIANPAIFYIYAGQDQYRGVQISNMLVHDSAPGYDFTQTKIETCADITIANFTAIPIVNLGIAGNSLYTTSPMFINLNATTYPSLRWNKSGAYWGGIGYNGVSNENYFGPCDAQGNWVASHDAERWRFLGALKIQNCGHTLTVGNLNADWTHFETTCSKFYFNHPIAVDGDLYPYTNNNRNLGLSSNYWNKTRSQWIYANAAGSSTDGGITLYANGDTNYGIFFRGTGNMGTHGSVTADWATYFTMSNTTGRGWVFRNTGTGNVASISAQGHMTVNGSIGINGTNVGYKLYVNGTSWIHGTLWTGHIYPESNNAYECGNGSYYWSSISTRWLHANRGSSNADGGITLYGTSPDYSIMFRGTGNQGTHGWVTSDWATYFTMNNQDNRGWVFRRYNSKNVFSIDTNGYVWVDGSLRANAVGKDGFATYPRGGHYSTSTPSVTGYLRIQLPVYRSNTMMKFIVDIYNYADNTSVSYAISGYNCQDGAWHSCTAECLSHHGQDKQNLTVAFGEINSKSAVMIGAASTTWNYPQVQIRDIVLGYSNWDYKYWNNADWVIDFSTSPIGNVTRSLSSTDNIKTSRGQFDQLVVINDASNNEYDSLAYFRNYSSSDWTMIIDKNNTYDYGLDIRTAGTYALRVNGSSRFNNSAIFGADAAPSYTVDVRGNMRSTGRIYSNEWIQFDNYTGLYSPLNNAHFYPNDSTSYGQWKILGSKGGYSGIQFGNSTGYMTVMDNGNDKGLYQQDQGMWMFYYNKANTSVSLRTASIWWGNAVNISGGLYVNGGNQYVSGYIQSGTRIVCGYDSGQAGSISCNNWFYSSGNTGWYNATYGGGWYMTDYTYIRNYGSKTTRLDNLCLGADNNSYRLYVNGTSYFNGDLSIPNNHAYYGILGSNSSTTSSDTGGLTWFNTSGTAGAQTNVNDTPTTAWWYILRNRHTNTSNNYYTDIAIPFNDTSIYYKIVRDGSVVNNAWIKVLDTNNYTETLDGRYVNVTGDTMTGALNLANGTWNKAGDDAYFGDNDTAGSFAIKGINGNTNLKMVTYGSTSYGTITWNGSQFVFSNGISGTLNGNAATATYTTQLLGVNDSNTPYGAIEGNLIRAVWNVKGDSRWYLKAGTYNCRVNYADDSDTVDGYHASQLWRSDGAVWNGGANVTCSGGSTEWSFDINSTEGNSYWHVWSSNQSRSMLACYPESSHVAIPIHLYVGGYNNTSYALSTSSFICNSWIRTTGATGWYNETYGGGWYMKDSTYIRNYNSKTVYITGRLGVNCELRMWARDNQITKDGLSVSWVNGRNSAIIRETTAEGWHAVVSAKTKNGSWEIGEYTSWANKLIFSYVKDSDYSSNNNTSTIPFSISPTRGIEISTLNYGTSVPSSGETGQIFFKI